MKNGENRAAVILAGGGANPLRGLADIHPLCLLTVAGKPLLQYHIDACRRADISDVLVIAPAPDAARVRAFCCGLADGMRITVVETPQDDVGSGVSALCRVQDLLAGREFIVGRTDVCVSPDVIVRLVQCPADSAVAVDSSGPAGERGGAWPSGMRCEAVRDAPAGVKSGTHAPPRPVGFYKFSEQGGRRLFHGLAPVAGSGRQHGDGQMGGPLAAEIRGAMEGSALAACDVAGSAWVRIRDLADLKAADRLFSRFDEHLRHIDTILFDLDGTLYLGDKEIPGARETVDGLRALGKRVCFLSNNSSKSKSQYVRRLGRLGIHAAEEDIILSTDGLIAYLQAQGVRDVSLLGTDSLRAAIESAGISTSGDAPDYVVIGYDTELTYAKLAHVCRHINAGVPILATHCDDFCPSEDGPLPDVGSFLAMIRVACGKTPARIFGKPTRDTIAALPPDSLIPERTLMVGDRLYTDMKFASTIGARGLLVLSGETSRDMLERSDVRPDFVLDSVADMLGSANGAR